MEKLIQSIEEDFESAKRRAITKIKNFFKEGNQTSSRTNMKLQFMNKIPPIILTGEEIKGEGDTPLQVALIDDPTGNVVDVGPEASASVEIVLLNGGAGSYNEEDWTVEEFIDSIVPEMDGKLPLLAGNAPLRLQRGIGVVENLSLRNHAIKIRPSVFKLGARAVDIFDGVRVKEAKTESFTAKDYRNKYYKKHKIPSLSDEVSRLVNIGRGGVIDKRLHDKEINTVEDFLVQLLINPIELESAVNLGPKKWEATINNARACPADKRLYCYVNLEETNGVAFNVLGEILGVYFGSHYFPSSMLSEKHKAVGEELLSSAKQNWANVKPFDDVNSLQQHLTVLSTRTDPPNSLKLDCRGGDHESAEASGMVGESSSGRSNVSFHSVSSTMNSFREFTSGEEFGSFGTDDVNVGETMYGWADAVHFPLNLETMFEDFDEFLKQNEGCNGQINESNGDEQSGVKSEVVQTSYRPKRWRKLLCVSRWFFIRKRVSADVDRNGKKQKIG